MLIDDVARPEHPDAKLVAGRPLAIEVRDLEKSFEIPLERVDSIKERVLRPFAHRETRRLRALDKISFEIHRGEFFGIVGRNGTGKSTLLKILASIYAADAGQIRMAGRVAPFIELGVGFNVDLTARENVILNGVMTGLTRREAEGRLEAVIEFAELEEFTDLKLKNYSSGMLVRLAFSVMIQSDAEILLVDEVLAVGDASFQQKCKDVFSEISESDRTVVLVTHDMSAVEQFCHRAMLLDDGDVTIAGDPHDVAQAYLRLNFSQHASGYGPVDEQAPDTELRLLDCWLETASGERTTNVEQFAPISLHAMFEAVREVSCPSFGFVLANSAGIEINGFGQRLTGATGDDDRIAPGERVHVSAKIENRLALGRYAIQGYAHRNASFSETILALPRILDFVVFGTDSSPGVVSVFTETQAIRESR